MSGRMIRLRHGDDGAVVTVSEAKAERLLHGGVFTAEDGESTSKLRKQTADARRKAAAAARAEAEAGNDGDVVTTDTGTEPVAPAKMTVPELREHLDGRGIKYASDDLKARLVELAEADPVD